MLSVIPAKAGIQAFLSFWTPAFAGVTAWRIFYEFINFEAAAVLHQEDV
jgi:hypothetical protein